MKAPFSVEFWVYHVSMMKMDIFLKMDFARAVNVFSPWKGGSLAPSLCVVSLRLTTSPSPSPLAAL